jgi:hypothetical protein
MRPRERVAAYHPVAAYYQTEALALDPRRRSYVAVLGISGT